MPPDLLETVVRDAVEEYVDPDALDRVLRWEQDDRAKIGRVLDQTLAEEDEALP